MDFKRPEFCVLVLFSIFHFKSLVMCVCVCVHAHACIVGREEGHPFSSLRDCLFNVVVVLCICRAPPSTTSRIRHAVETKDPFNMEYSRNERISKNVPLS
jgi:hypothetical protein